MNASERPASAVGDRTDAPGGDPSDGDVSAQVADGVRRGRDSPAGRVTARVGMASRAVVYLSLAVVVGQLAFGPRPDDTDQAGALTALGGQPAGVAVLWLLVVGVACYVLWRFSEVVGGPSSGEDTVPERVKAAVEGLAYVPIAIISGSIAAGHASSAQQGGRYRSLSAHVMQDWSGGRLLVGAIGVAVVALGLYLASEGPRRSFRSDLDFAGNRPAERVVVTAGLVGSTARGLVFALAGVLVVAAAVTADPDKAGGIDAALRSVANESYGPWLLLVVAVGLACYAVFAVGEAVWRKV